MTELFRYVQMSCFHFSLPEVEIESDPAWPPSITQAKLQWMCGAAHCGTAVLCKAASCDPAPLAALAAAARYDPHAPCRFRAPFKYSAQNKGNHVRSVGPGQGPLPQDTSLRWVCEETLQSSRPTGKRSGGHLTLPLAHCVLFILPQII